MAAMRTQRNSGVGRNVTRSWWALVLGGVAILCAPLLAHHSFAVYYLESDTIEVEGDVVEFQYKNPHAWVHIVGQEPFGRPKTYAAEWASTSRLERDGIDKLTLRAGDSVRIWGSPSRSPNDNRIRLKRIERRSDGWRWGQNGRESR
jgi:hypothetical protein